MEITDYVESYTGAIQKEMYDELKDFSIKHSYIGRSVLIGASVVDGALEVISRPLAAIQFVVFAAMNLIGKVFSSKCTLGHSWKYTQMAALYSFASLLQPIFTVLTLIYQTGRILQNPQNAQKLTDAFEDLWDDLSTKVQEMKA